LLLSTPLSSREIVLGKWLAHYRTVPFLALLPAMVATAHAIPTGRWPGVSLVVATILADGAAVTSLGIALAIWVPRLDRALTLSAAVAVFITIAWIPLMFLLFREDRALGVGLASASPLFGVGLLTSAIAVGPTATWGQQARWALLWILVAGAASVALLGAALATFDRCLGRISGRVESPHPGRSRILARTCVQPPQGTRY